MLIDAAFLEYVKKFGAALLGTGTAVQDRPELEPCHIDLLVNLAELLVPEGR